MSEAEKPKRQFWQISLQSAVLLLFLTGALLLVNIRVRWKWSELSSFRRFTASWNGERGWPFWYYNGNYTVDEYEGLGEGRLQSKYSQTNPPPFKIDGLTPYEIWNFNSLAGDVVLGGTVLFIATFVSEFIIRRREARKT